MQKLKNIYAPLVSFKEFWIKVFPHILYHSFLQQHAQ